MGQAFALATTNDWIRLSRNPAIFAQTVGTVEFWVKITSLQEDTVRLFSVAEAGVAFPDADQWEIDYRYVDTAPGAIQVNLVAGGAIVMSPTTPAGTIADTNWHHIAVIADGVDPIQVYVDGAVQVLSGSTSDRFFGHALNASVMAVGAIVRESVFAEGIKLIDELAIYDRALSSNEIAAIYAAGSAGMCRPPFSVPAGLMSWWPAEDNFLDLVGTNHGTPMAAVGFVPGKVGQAFDFNGVDRYIVMPPILTNAATFTFEWWMKVRSFTHPDYMVTFSQAPPTYIPSSLGFNFYVGNGGASFGLLGHWTDGAFFDLRTDIPFGTGVWKHVAVTYDGTVLKQYVDGAWLNQGNYADKTPGNAHPFLIGKGYAYPGGVVVTTYFDGQIDEFSVYTRALGSNEVAAIYAAGSAGKAPPPTLAVSLASGGVLLSWPASAEGFGLVSRSDLAAGSWEAVTNEPSLNGARKEVLIPVATPAQRFFRLAQ